MTHSARLNSDTTMANAFISAGYVPAEERLRDIAIAALANNPKSHDSVRDEVFKGIRGEADLLWCLFEKFRRDAVDALIMSTRITLRNEAALLAEAEEPMLRRSPGYDRSSANLSRDDGRYGSRQAPAARPAPACREPQVPSIRHQMRVEARAAVELTLSRLDTIIVNGRPIGDITPNEALAWADHNELRVKFVRMVTAGVPPEGVIRAYIMPDEADEMWLRVGGVA